MLGCHEGGRVLRYMVFFVMELKSLLWLRR
jgi:hypothetical protein